jgi:hypothetical protein
MPNAKRVFIQIIHAMQNLKTTRNAKTMLPPKEATPCMRNNPTKAEPETRQRDADETRPNHALLAVTLVVVVL